VRRPSRAARPTSSRRRLCSHSPLPSSPHRSRSQSNHAAALARVTKQLEGLRFDAVKIPSQWRRRPIRASSMCPRRPSLTSLCG
jgi:hypothetical protein